MSIYSESYARAPWNERTCRRCDRGYFGRQRDHDEDCPGESADDAGEEA